VPYTRNIITGYNMQFNLRNLAAYVYSIFLRTGSGIPSVLSRSARGEIILSVYSHNPDKKLFEKTVRWFRKRNFRFLDVNELYEILSGKSAFPTRGVFFSLDDGWKENYKEVVQLSHRIKIPLTIFIPTEPVLDCGPYWWTTVGKAYRKGFISIAPEALKKMPDEKRSEILEKARRHVSLRREAMLPEEVKKLPDKNITVGSHTLTHPILTMCNDEKSRIEITESRIELEKWLGMPVMCFSYPNGLYGQREKEFVRAAGYRMAFTTERKYMERNVPQDLLELPRFDLLEHVSFSENICRMTGVWFSRKQKKA
jgi:peptidoglycan/xylan/chitin deacetylase (PgdA/CDA1 family)